MGIVTLKSQLPQTLLPLQVFTLESTTNALNSTPDKTSKVKGQEDKKKV